MPRRAASPKPQSPPGRVLPTTRARVTRNTHSPLTAAQKAPINQLVLPPQYSRRILYASSLMAGSIVSAVHNECYDNACLAALVLFSSVNYWRHPVLGRRRHFDMLCANGSLVYQCLYTSQYTSRAARQLYWATVLAGGVCYFVGRRFSARHKNLRVSSSLHVCLHVFGNIGNWLLYDSLGANALSLS